MSDFITIQNTDAFTVEVHPYAENLCFISTGYHKRMAYPHPTVQVRQDGGEFYDEDEEENGPGIMEPLPADASQRIVRRLEAGEHLTATDIPAEDVLAEVGLTRQEVRRYTSGEAACTIYSPEEYAASFVAEREASGDETPGKEEFRRRWGCEPQEFVSRLKAGTLPKHSDFEETGAVSKYGEPIWFVLERYD